MRELETLPAGTKPRVSFHQSPEGEKSGRRKCSTIFPEGRERENVTKEKMERIGY